MLFIGGLGQLGTACAQLLRSKYGKENVILSDIIKPNQQIIDEGPYIFADILDFKGLQKTVVTHRIDWIIHFSALLSAIGEQNVSLAVRVNIEGMHNMIELAKQYKLRIFVPSTIGAFGPVSCLTFRVFFSFLLRNFTGFATQPNAQLDDSTSPNNLWCLKGARRAYGRILSPQVWHRLQMLEIPRRHFR